MTNLRRFEPIFALIWGLAVNLLIANGYLTPQQHDMWINGGLELIGALGSVSLFTVYLHHTLNKNTQKEVHNTVQGLIESISQSNTTGSADIPVNSPKQTTVHVNVP